MQEAIERAEAALVMNEYGEQRHYRLRDDSPDRLADVAWRVHGFVRRDTPETVWTGLQEVDTDRCRATMVGDDCAHDLEVADLIPVDQFCRDCGSLSCTHAR